MAGLPDLPFVSSVLLAWSLAAPPGPINALMAHAAARRGFWSGWSYGLGAIAGDLTMLALTGLGVLRIVEALPWLRVAFAAAGAVLMGWFAWGAFRTARRVAQKLGRDDEDRPEPWPRAAGKAYAIVVTSPYNWTWWLTAGSSMLALLGWLAGIGFFVGLILWTIAWTALSTAGAARMKRFTEIVSYGAAVVLVVFALIMAVAATRLAYSLLAA